MVITQGHSLRRELRNFKQVTSSSIASPAIAASWIKQVDSSLSIKTRHSYKLLLLLLLTYNDVKRKSHEQGACY